MDLTKLSKQKLIEKCKELGLTKYKSKNKDELIKLINSQKEQQQQTEFTIQNPKQETLSIDGIVILNSDCIIELNKLEDNSIV